MSCTSQIDHLLRAVCGKLNDSFFTINGEHIHPLQRSLHTLCTLPELLSSSKATSYLLLKLRRLCLPDYCELRLAFLDTPCLET